MRALPASCITDAFDTWMNVMSTWPAMMSVRIGAVPLYGTCTMLVPVSFISITPVRCEAVPTPCDAKLALPGLALSQAIAS